MFEPSAHCPDCRKSIPSFWLLSTPNVPLALLSSHGFLTCDRFMQLLVILVHGFPFWCLDTLDNDLTDGMPDRAEGHHLLFPTSVVSTKLRNIPSSSSRSVSSSAPSRITTSRTSVVNFGFTTFSTPCSYPDQLSPTQATSLLKRLYQHLDWAVTVVLLVFQQLERIDQGVAKPQAVHRALEKLLLLDGQCCLVPDVLPFSRQVVFHLF